VRLLSATIPDDCDIALIGDDHNGLQSRSDDGVAALIDWVAKKRNRRFIHLGDALESRCIDHKFFDIDNSRYHLPQKQIEQEAKEFKPIASKCLAWLMGNHEWGQSKVMDMTLALLERMGIPEAYGGLACKLKLENSRGDAIGKVYLQHKTRGRFTSNAKDYEQRAANVRASVKMSLLNKACDCHVMACGHAHQVVCVPPSHILGVNDDGKTLGQVYLDDIHPRNDAAYIDPNQRWYACTGSFLRTSVVGIESYAERAGYDPVEIGWVVMEVRNNRIVGLQPVYYKG
jgi:hypothetical protein